MRIYLEGPTADGLPRDAFPHLTRKRTSEISSVEVPSSSLDRGMPFPKWVLCHLAAWNTIFADSHPLDSILFDDVSNDDLNAGTVTSGLDWPPPLFAGSSIIASSDDNLLTYPLITPASEDDNNNVPVLTGSSPSCEPKRSLRRANGDNDGALRTRDGASSSQSCASELNLPLEVFSDPESYLRDNIPLDPSIPGDREVPDEYFEPLFLPDGSENDAAKLNPGEGDAGSPCISPYIWHVCCDFSFGCRPSIYFVTEQVADCMSGCHISASSFRYYTRKHCR